MNLFKMGSRIREINKLPCEVDEIGDLPERLFMGKLNEESFKKTNNGYSVKYSTNRQDTYFDLIYDKENESVTGEPFFGGNSGGKLWLKTNTKFREFIKHYGFGFNQQWVNTIQENYKDSNFILSLPSEPEENKLNLLSFPDGFPIVVVIPITFKSLYKINNMVSLIKSNPNIISTINCNLSLTSSMISYREGMCKNELYDKDFIFKHHLFNSGVLPKDPDWVEFQNGIRCFSIRRLNYNIIIDCFIQDIFEIMSCLKETDILKKKSTYDISNGNDLEDKIWIVNSGTELLKGEFQTYNDDKSMRISYESLTNEYYINHLTDIENYNETKTVDEKIENIEITYTEFLKNLTNEIEIENLYSEWNKETKNLLKEYEYIFHQNTPEELDTNPDELIDDFVPSTSVTFVLGPYLKTHKQITETLSQLKKYDKKIYQESKKELLEIQSRVVEELIKRKNDDPSLLETFVNIIYPDCGFELCDVSVGYSVKGGNYSPTIVINVDEIKSDYGKSKDDFLVKSKLDQLGSILGDSLNLKWIRIDIFKPSPQ